MNPRPQIKIEMTTSDKVVEGASWLAIIALWAITLSYFFKLPDTIPTHFDAAGVPNGHGDKWMFMLMPGIGTILFIAMSILVHYPHLFNFPTKLTAENAPRLYQLGIRLISLLKLNLCVVFSLMTWMTAATALGNAVGLGVWLLPFALGLILVPIVVSIVQMMRVGK